MKTKHIMIIAAAALAVSCSKAEETAAPGEQALVLAPYMAQDSKAAVNYPVADYFAIDGYADVILDNIGNDMVSYTYDSATGTLSAADGEDPIYFPLDGSGITFVVVWPSEEIREESDEAPLKDQTTLENFLKSDWLYAFVDNAQPAERVPVQFKHMFSKYVFRPGGANMGGTITALSIGEYEAYCEPSSGEAWLVMPYGVVKAGVSGTVSIDGVGDELLFTIATTPEGIADGSHHTITVNVQ